MNGKDFLRLIIVAIIPLFYFALVVNKNYSSIKYNGDHAYSNITNVTVNRLTKSLCDDDQNNKWNAKPKKSIRNGKYIVLYNYFRVRLFIKYTISTWNYHFKNYQFSAKKDLQLSRIYYFHHAWRISLYGKSNSFTEEMARYVRKLDTIKNTA